MQYHNNLSFAGLIFNKSLMRLSWFHQTTNMKNFINFYLHLKVEINEFCSVKSKNAKHDLSSIHQTYPWHRVIVLGGSAGGRSRSSLAFFGCQVAGALPWELPNSRSQQSVCPLQGVRVGLAVQLSHLHTLGVQGECLHSPLLAICFLWRKVPKFG